MNNKDKNLFKYSGYEWQQQLRDEVGGFELGLTSGSTYYRDPRRLLFMLSRYKFVAKMTDSDASVLEIGCGDGFGSRVVKQVCKSYSGIDIEPIFIKEAKKRYLLDIDSSFEEHDILASPYRGRFDLIFSLDVLEHIQQELEDRFFLNARSCLNQSGVMIVGMPSLESQAYASDQGVGHINCKTSEELKSLAKKYFSNVFTFEMNDELVHTGYSKMSHYHIVLCCKPLQ